MQPPKDAKVYEFPSSTVWLDEHGIICSVSKKVPPETLEQSKKTLEEFRRLFGNQKHCMLLDITHSSPSTKETRDWAAEEFPKIVKAIAMISNSALGRMVANLFFGLKPPPYPTRMFSNEAEAKEWLMQYL